MTLVSSPAAAYRADMRERGEPFSAHDDQWLAAASELHHAVANAGQVNKDHLYDAIGVAIEVLGDECIDDFVNREWSGEHCYVESLVVLANEMHWVGALHLAAFIFDDVLRAAGDLSLTHRGRILALRARLEWKLGRYDDAADRYSAIADMALQSTNAELAIRADLGFVAIAQMRGNLPELRTHAEAAAASAEEYGYPHLARLAFQGLTIAETKEGRFGAAVAAAWKVLQLSRGESTSEAEALQNLGQLMLGAGHPQLARACFAAVATLTIPARLMLNALGGLALASARCGTETTVEWAVREVWQAQREAVPSYELAEALVECAASLALLGRREDSERYKATANQLATVNGFNELLFRVQAIEPARRVAEEAPPFDDMPPVLARQIAALEPEQLPRRARFSTAPA